MMMIDEEQGGERRPLQFKEPLALQLSNILTRAFEGGRGDLNQLLTYQSARLIALFADYNSAHQSLFGPSIVRIALDEIVNELLKEDGQKQNSLVLKINSFDTSISLTSDQKTLNIVIPAVLKRIVDYAEETLKRTPPFNDDNKSENWHAWLMRHELQGGLSTVVSKYLKDQTYFGLFFGKVERNPLRSLGALLIFAGITWNLLLNYMPGLDKYQDSKWIEYPTIAFGVGVLLLGALSIAERVARYRIHELSQPKVSLVATPEGKRTKSGRQPG